LLTHSKQLIFKSASFSVFLRIIKPLDYQMAFKKRLTILLEPEIKDLYGIPTLSVEQKRVFFYLNRIIYYRA